VRGIFSRPAGLPPAVLAGVALGFTIYSGLQSEGTAMDIALGTISGALSGAMLGMYIGSIFPGVGTVIGGIVGALAGGLLGGGAAAMGKGGPKKISASERSEAQAAISAGNLSAAIDAAASIEDLVTIFNTRWSPYGEVQILTHYQGVWYWAGDWDDPAGPLATAALMIIPEFLDELLISRADWEPPTATGSEDKFRAKRDEILETLSNVPFGILESDRAAGLTRRTHLPFQKLYGSRRASSSLREQRVLPHGSRRRGRDGRLSDRPNSGAFQPARCGPLERRFHLPRLTTKERQPIDTAAGHPRSP
jgi:hypothetical protein